MKEIFNSVLFIICVLVLSFFIVTFIGQRTTVNGTSMEQTLQDGDNLIVDKVSYRFSDPKRFDIIIFPPRADDDTLYIKRIIGMPGETVRIDEFGIIYIDEVILSENYGNATIENPGIAIDGVTLGEDEYFVLGDNRNNSSDSRLEQVGNIHRDEIVGKAFFRIYPFDNMGKLRHA